MRKHSLQYCKLFSGFLSICFFLLVSITLSAQEKKKAEVKQEGKNGPTFTVVQIPAQFPGGVKAWTKYLEKNLDKSILLQHKAPPGKYTVTVSFIVDKKGELSDIHGENDPGYGTKKEAERIFKQGPKWSPAYQNWHKVIYRHKQNITFQI